jgi:signal peptidase I
MREHEVRTPPPQAVAAPGAKSVLREYAEALIIAILLALVIRAFVVQAFKIPSGSMLPTLEIGDHILVNKFLYYFTSPQRGDVIVFKFPQDESRDFIKRVIGLPGETVEVRGKEVLVNGVALREPYAVYGDMPGGMVGEHWGPQVVPPGRLFVMGDNRDHSMDSRVWGFLEIVKVKGRAFMIYFSIRSEEIPYNGAVPGIVYVLSHPSMVRWARIGSLIH